MKRIIALLLAAAVLGCAGAGIAEGGQQAPDYLMEGLDGDSSITRVWEDNLFFSRMQEKTGISFQFRQYSDYEMWTGRKEAILKGEDLPDVLFKASLSADDIRDMYEAGVIIDLKPYLEEYAPDLWALLQEHGDWQEAITTSDGAIPSLPSFNELQNNDLIWINREWLEKLKLEKPKTAGELTEVLRRFKTGDPNRNGRSDEVPLTFIGMWELRFLGHAFGIIDNDDYIRLEDGKVVSSLTSDSNREFLTWLHQLWQEGLLDHSGFTTTDSLRQVTDENATITYGAMLGPTPLTVVPNAASEKYDVLMPLEYNGERKYRDLAGDVVLGTFAITSACREPEKLVSWVNRLYTEEGSMLAQCGLDGEEYEWNEDGYWEWNYDLTTVAQEILPNNTISEGGTAPGICPADFQLKYGDAATRRIVEQVYEIKGMSVHPFPYLTPDREDEARMNTIRLELMSWAEQAMACFVTGDTEMNDETWADFCSTADKKGLTELMEIWQKYVR